MRDLIQKLWTAIRSGFWSKPSEAKDHGDPMDWKWINDPFYEGKPISVDPRTTELRLLDSQIERLANMIRKAKKNKKKWLPMNAKLKQLQDRRAKLSGTL